MINYRFSIFKKNNSLVISLLLICFYFSFTVFSPNFKIEVVFSFIIAFLLYQCTKSLFISLFLVFLTSSQFVYPAKEYVFEYLSPNQYDYYLFPDGINEYITFSISNIFGLWISFYLLNVSIRFYLRVGLKKSIEILRSYKIFSGTILIWVLYFVLGYFTSLRQSFYPEFSLDILLYQYNFLILYLGIVYIYLVQADKSKYIKIFLFTWIIVQSTLGILQLVSNIFSVNIPDKLQLMDIEQNVPIARITGITASPNGHALYVLLAFLLYSVFQKKITRSYALIFTISMLNIIASQARSIWFLVACIFIVGGVLFKKQIRQVKIKIPRRILYGSIFFAIVICIVYLPRLTGNSPFSEDGGGLLRITMIKEGFLMLQESLFFGNGLGASLREMVITNPNSYARTFPNPVHMAYLELALDTGILASLALFSPLFMLFGLFVTRGRVTVQKYFLACSILSIIVFYLTQPIDLKKDFQFIVLCIAFGHVYLHLNSLQYD